MPSAKDDEPEFCQVRRRQRKALSAAAAWQADQAKRLAASLLRCYHAAFPPPGLVMRQFHASASTALAVAALHAVGCSSAPTTPGNGPVVSGTSTIPTPGGIDFSAQAVESLDWSAACHDTAAFIDGVSKMDFVLECAEDEGSYLGGSPEGLVPDSGPPWICGDLVFKEPSLKRLSATSVDEVVTIPTNDLERVISGEPPSSLVGTVFGLKTKDGKWAVFSVTSLEDVAGADFKTATVVWKYQTDGTPDF